MTSDKQADAGRCPECDGTRLVDVDRGFGQPPDQDICPVCQPTPDAAPMTAEGLLESIYGQLGFQLADVDDCGREEGLAVIRKYMADVERREQQFAKPQTCSFSGCNNVATDCYRHG